MGIPNNAVAHSVTTPQGLIIPKLRLVKNDPAMLTQHFQATISPGQNKQTLLSKKLSSSYDSSTLAFFNPWQGHLPSPIHCTAAQTATPAQTHTNWEREGTGQEERGQNRTASFCGSTRLCKRRKCKCSSAAPASQQCRGPDAKETFEN